MDVEFVRDLFLNAAILLAATVLQGYVFERYCKKKIVLNILMGCLTGMIGILLIANAVYINSGVFFDVRSVLVSTTAMFFGIIPTAIAVVIISIARLVVGGSGAFTGVFVTVITAGTGLVWRRFRYGSIMTRSKYLALDFYLLGLVTHIIMLAGMLTLPRDMVASVLRGISLPVLLVNPLDTLLVCAVIMTRIKKIQAERDLKESELRLRTVYEQAPIGVAIEKNRTIVDCNRMYEKILGRTKEEVMAHGWETFMHPADLSQDEVNYRALQIGLIDEYAMDKRFLKPDGSVIWTRISLATLKMRDAFENDHLLLLQDITENVKAKENLEASVSSYRNLYHEYKDKQSLILSLLDSTPDVIFYKDTNSTYMGCNKAFERLIGRTEEEIIGLTDYDILDKELADFVRRTDTIALQENRLIKFEQSLTYPNGDNVLVEMAKTPYYDADGNLLGVICISRDITERKRWENRILYLNQYDVLTDVHNRMYFEEAQQQLDMQEHLPISIIMGDVDGLKLINDALGHREGDALLTVVAGILKKHCRPKDIVARIGGDEFCMLLPDTDSDTARNIMEEIHHDCEEYAARPGREVYYTNISLGYASKTKADESLGTVIKTAEEYMYRRKLLAHKSLHGAIMASIKATLYEKSNETEEHAERMAAMAKMLGIEMGLRADQLDALELAATLHDIGKISIDLSILKKPGKLNEEEWVEMRKHPEAGYRIAQSVPELQCISEIILCHHERWDGTGYPQRLAGEDIPLLSRIVSLVDSYDAMTENRPYRQALSKEAAVAEIVQAAGTQFDPEVVKIFVEKVLSTAGV